MTFEQETKKQKYLKAINEEDAYHYLCNKASKLLDCRSDSVNKFVDYYFDNKEHFDCTFEEWLLAENGPLYRLNIRGLFPELELISSNQYEVAEMARNYYGIDIQCEPEWEGGGVYSFEFNFKELNKKRVNLKDFKKEVKELLLRKLEGE